MSVLWERRVGGKLYQVRQAGRSLRLYSNGVFHSQYNPGRPVTGSVWDLLFIPAFFYPQGRLQRILVLGVGGGAVIQQLRRFIAPEMILGIDLNPVHLSVARRFFGVRGAGVRLLHADAIEWVERYRGPPFDMIVDDLFGEVDGQPQRAIHAGPDWLAALHACLGDGGLIVSNFATRLELDVSAYRTSVQWRGRFASAFALHTPQNYNVVGAFAGTPVTGRALRERLKRIPQLDPRRRGGLRYRIRRLVD